MTDSEKQEIDEEGCDLSYHYRDLDCFAMFATVTGCGDKYDEQSYVHKQTAHR